MENSAWAEQHFVVGDDYGCITSPPSGGRRLPDSVRARIAEALSRFSVPWRGAALEREENGDEGRG